MKIFFAGYSGKSNIPRLQIWLNRGMKNKLISFFDLMGGVAKVEFDYLKKVKDEK